MIFNHPFLSQAHTQILNWKWFVGWLQKHRRKTKNIQSPPQEHDINDSTSTNQHWNMLFAYFPSILFMKEIPQVVQRPLGFFFFSLCYQTRRLTPPPRGGSISHAWLTGDLSFLFFSLMFYNFYCWSYRFIYIHIEKI